MSSILEIFRDLPGFLDGFILEHGMWVYALLFAIIFAETGLVIIPFLPGDSLLFTVGAIAARGAMNVWTVSIVLLIAAVLGDTVNYHIGKWVGPRIFRGEGNTGFARLVNRKHLARAHEFFDYYGGKAIILARFVPIARTFVPFVAGAGSMNYQRFIAANLVGAAAWVGICVGAGFWFGNIEFVKRNFEAVIVGIIVVSLIPLAVEAWLQYRRKSAAERNITKRPLNDKLN
jgi:membrane-associated protein